VFPVGKGNVQLRLQGDKFADKTWPQDRDVALIIRGSVNPRTRDDAPALQAILLARRTRA
jgi:hypothetical protein